MCSCCGCVHAAAAAAATRARSHARTQHLPVGVAAAAGNPAYLPLVSPPSIAAAVAATTAAAWHEALSSPDAAAAVLGATSGVPAIAWRAYAVRVADTRPLPRNGADLPSWAEAVWTTAMTAGGGAWNHADRGPELAALTRCPRATELYLCAAVLMVAVGGGMVWGGDLTLLSAKLRAELAGVPPPRPNMFVRPMEVRGRARARARGRAPTPAP